MADVSPGSARELRVVLAGAGKMARHHAGAIAASRIPARVVAVADPSPEACAAIQEIAPEAQAFDFLADVLAVREADVVHVCTPPRTHADLAVQAIEAGCHVYVEKPFAPDTDEAGRILAAAGKHGARVCAGHQLLFERPARDTWRLMPALGRVQHIESYFAFRPVRGRGGQAPVRDEDQLLDVLPHPVYVLLEAFAVAGAVGPVELVSLTVGEGTVHVLLRSGALVGALVVTLTGRPVDSYLRLVGTNGSLHADFVRGIVLRQVGPGSSGIDKLLAPYRSARQLSLGTTAAMIRRLVGRKRSYPGLKEAFEAFYSHLSGEAPAPMSHESILETVRIQERVAAALVGESRPVRVQATGEDLVLVTGGTGFLGRSVVEELVRLGRGVRVLARREPAEWRRIDGVEYVTGDLAERLNSEWFDNVSAVVHCAAATSGGWREHQSASIDATGNVLDMMAATGCRRLVHVSSIAVVDEPSGRISEASGYLADPRSAGPYAWGKLESERLARRRGGEAPLDVTIVRPGAIFDSEAFDPPGRLGRRLGNIFVAVGGSGERLGVVGVEFCARVIASLADGREAPEVVHLLEPELPTRHDLVDRLRRRNPGLRVVWIPRWGVRPLCLLLIGAQKLLRPGSSPIDLAAVFGNREYDTAVATRLSHSLGPNVSSASFPTGQRATSQSSRPQ